MTPEMSQAIRALAAALRACAQVLDQAVAEQLPPAPARPAADPPLEPKPRPAPRPGDRQDRPERTAATFDGLPTTGKALWLWLKSQGEETGVDLVKEMTAWSKTRGWGHKFTELGPSQVADVVAEATRRLDGVVYT